MTDKGHKRKIKDHRRTKTADRELLFLLAPVVPIILLLVLILLLEGKPVEESEAVIETEPVTEAETVISEEEQARILYDRTVREYTERFTEFGVVLSDGTVNFRSSPDNSVSDNKIGELEDMEIVEVISEKDNWLKITRSGAIGYVSKEFCITGQAAVTAAEILLGTEEAEKLSNPGLILTEGNDVNIYSEMHTNDLSLVIGRLAGGDAFDVLSKEENGWLKISSGGMEGYIVSSRVVTGEEAVKIAKIKSSDRLHVLCSVMPVRTTPAFANDNRLTEISRNEWFDVVSTEIPEADEAGWVQIEGVPDTEGEQCFVNLNGGNAELVFGLKEAEEINAKDLVTEEYDNLIVCTTSGYVNVRSSTETSSYKNIVGKIYSGAGAELIETIEPSQSKNGKKWYHISSGGVSGYVSAGDGDSDYFAVGAEAEEQATQLAHLTASITTDCLNVRSTPDNKDDSNVWTQVTRGQAYEVLDQEGEWVKIDLGTEEGNDAYIYKGDSFIRLSYGLDEAIEFSYAEKASAFRQSVVDYACQFIGNPYVWGGTSLTKGCDCSGFVQQIMKHYGISMERSSYYQVKQGVKRTSKTMRPGDLIFYANSSGTVNHVVIYIGGGYMVGAQSKRAGIKIYKWNYRTPVAIRDVIGDRVE